MNNLMFIKDKIFEKRPRRRLLAATVTVAMGVFAISCSSDPKSDAAEHAPSAERTTHLQKADGARSDQEDDNGGYTDPAEAPNDNHILSSNLTQTRGFDSRHGENEFSATIIGLGDVTVRSDGSTTVTPTPLYDPSSGMDSSENWKFSTKLATVAASGISGETQLLDIDRPADTFVAPDGSLTLSYAEGLSVHYRNFGTSLKQAITISERFSDSKDIRLRWDIHQSMEAKIRPNGGATIRSNETDRIILEWTPLRVFDSNGDEVAAKMKIESEHLVYSIDSREADFPIKIDPLAQNPSFQDSGSQASSLFGQNVASAGDVDGYEDLLVSQTGFDDGATSSVGKAYLFLGSSSGTASTASWTTKGTTLEEFYGIGTGIGDIDGDGNDDSVISGFRWISGNQDLGQVKLFLGGATATGLNTSAAETISGSQSDQFFGRSVAGGDFNCDGTPDVAVGSPGYDGSAGGGSGKIEIFFGNTSSPYLPNSASWTYESSKAGANLGQDIENAGDVNNDGCDDLIAGGGQYPNSSGTPSGIAVLFYGSNSGISSTPDWSRVGQANSQYGLRISPAGDVDGDGFDDIAVGAQGANAGDGLVEVFYGSTSGPSSSPDWSDSGSNGAKLGSGLASGDVNGDGTPDLVVGATDETEPSSGSRFGSVRLYLTGPGPSPSLSSSPNWQAYSSNVSSLYGFTVATVRGSQTAGGEDDIFVGAPLHKNMMGQSSAGSVFGYQGQPTCYIGGTYYAAGDTNPNNACEVCTPSQNNTSWSTKSVGATCDDGNACTENTTCNSSGQCTGSQVNCDDGNPCTQNQCDPQMGCSYPPEPQGTACTDDGKTCTTDQCDGNGACTHSVTSGCLIDGSCVSQGQSDPSAPCLQCVPSQSTTSYSAVSAGTPCNDGSYCTVSDTCNASGQCTGSPRNCADTVDPSIAACNNSFSCDDVLDKCRSSQPKSDGTSCDDGNACTSMETCQSGVCQAGSTVTCSDPGTCQSASCNPDTGTCETTNDPDGSTCETGDACTTGACQSGSCMTQGPVDCDDMNPCTADSCDSQTGCQNSDVPDGTEIGTPSCNDNFNLLQSATCQDGEPQDPTIQDCGNYKCSSDPNPNCPTACTEDSDCKDGSFCTDVPGSNDGDLECVGNRPPTADAGPDQGGYSKNERVRLDGTQSSDPDNDMLSYTWSLVDANCPDAGESADLAGLQQAINDQDQWDPTAANPQFSAPAPDCENEELTFELEVSDGTYTVTDEAVVSYGTCNNPPNAVVAGQPATAEWGSSVTLDASNSQPGCGSSLEYSWSYMPQEPELTTSGSESLSVTLPDICREESTTYTFNLTVFDGVQNSEPYDRDLFVPANGPCDDGGDVSGSGGCSSTGNSGGPIGGLAAMLFAGGLAALRRRRRN